MGRKETVTEWECDFCWTIGKTPSDKGLPKAWAYLGIEANPDVGEPFKDGYRTICSDCVGKTQQFLDTIIKKPKKWEQPKARG